MTLKTKVQREEDRISVLNDLLEFAGSQSHLAKMLGISSRSVHGWVYRGKISKKGVELIQQHPELSLRFSSEILNP